MKLSMSTLNTSTTFWLPPHVSCNEKDIRKFFAYYRDISHPIFLCKQREPRRLHHPSSLRGSDKGVLNLNSVHHCIIPEAISLHYLTDERFSTVIKSRHCNLRARRLLGVFDRLRTRLSISRNTYNLVTAHLTLKTLQRKSSNFVHAMTNESKRVFVGWAPAHQSEVRNKTSFVSTFAAVGGSPPYTFLKGTQSC